MIRTPNSLAHLEIDEEEVKEKAYKVFNGRFGNSFVTKIFLANILKVMNWLFM